MTMRVFSLINVAGAFSVAGAFIAPPALRAPSRALTPLSLRCSAPMSRATSGAPMAEDEINELKALCALCERGQEEMLSAKAERAASRRGSRAAALAAVRECSDRRKIGQHKKTLEPLRSVKEYTSFISAHGRVRDSRSALILFAEMERAGFAADVVCLAALIAACVRGGQWRRALDLFESMPSRGLAPNVFAYSSAIAACDKGGEWPRALALLDEMPARGLLPNVVIYNCAISALANAAEWQRALELLEVMRRRGLTPDAISFNSAISACEKAGRWDQALALLYRAELCGVKPDAVSFSAAIAACGKGGQWERAMQLLEAMERRGVEPSVYAYNACIAACGAAGQPECALTLFERLENDPSLPLQPDLVSYNAVLDAVAPQRSCARRLWKRGIERGLYKGCEHWDGPSRAVPMLDLHDLSEGAAEAAVRWWLEERVPSRLAASGNASPPTRLELVTGWGKNRASHQSGDLRDRVEAVLADMGVATIPSRNPGVLHAYVTPVQG